MCLIIQSLHVGIVGLKKCPISKLCIWIDLGGCH